MFTRIIDLFSRVMNKLLPCKFGVCRNPRFGCTCGNIGKMLTPPKSKSPWEAMTVGSTRGWAAPLQSWGPAFTAVAGATPWGWALSPAMGAIGMAGKGTGFQGTDKGWGNLGSTALGALGGYGLGNLGAGVWGGIKGALGSGWSGILPGIQKGVGAFNKPYIDAFGKVMNWFGAGSKAGTAGAAAGPIGRQDAYSALQNELMAPEYARAATNPATGMGYSDQFGGGVADLYNQWGAGTGWSSQALSGMPGATTYPTSSGVMTTGPTQQGTAVGGWNLKDIMGAATTIGGGFGMFGKEAPTYEMPTAEERYGQMMNSVVAKYLGPSGLELPKRAQEEYMKLIETPFGDMYEKWNNADNRIGEVTDQINRSYDKELQRVDEAYAQSGGLGSTGPGSHAEARNELTRLRGEETRKAVNQIRYQNFQEAVNVKMDALKNAMAQGQWSAGLALDLAKLAGNEDQLAMAIESQNYGDFQAAMARIMMLGYGMIDPKKLEQYGIMQPQYNML